MTAPTIPPVVPTDMTVAKLTAIIGAEISGVDLGEIARSDALFAHLKALLLEHKVLFFRDQPISRAEHVALARRFGPLEDHPVAPTDPDNPGLVRIYKDLDSAPEHYENGYHCDGTWKQIPPMGAVLRCVETPPVGGDTVWVNMVQAYEDLPAHIKEQIEPLRARHSIEATFGAVLPIERRHQLKQAYPDAEHPVVRTHPETGERILYVSGFATHFVNFHTPANVRYGFDYAPGGSQLLNYLIGRAAIPEYQVRWRWTKDSFAIWDNRSTQHYAVQDYWPAVRKMERAGIVGEPF
jgi:alpha-ketoglutarate-dependent taurine dioxygenase